MPSRFAGTVRRRSLVAALACAVVILGLVVAGSVWVVGRALTSSGSADSGSAQSGATSQAAATDFGPAPTYTLTDQTGHRVSSKQFAGKVRVVSFLFPYCTTDCPLLAHDLVQLQRRLTQEGLGDKVEIVTFNVDPAGAGPAQLRRFIAQYGGEADPDAAGVPWHYLTGTAGQIRRTVEHGFHVSYHKVTGAEEGGKQRRNPLAHKADVGYDIKHANALFLVDGDGRIVALRRGVDATDPAALADAVSAALPSSGD